VLRHDGDPRNLLDCDRDRPHSASHRLRTADIDGSGKRVVVNAALAAPMRGPDYRGYAPLVCLPSGRVERQPITRKIAAGPRHLYHRLDGDGRDEILTAGFEGISSVQAGEDGQWTRTKSPGRPFGVAEIRIQRRYRRKVGQGAISGDH